MSAKTAIAIGICLLMLLGVFFPAETHLSIPSTRAFTPQFPTYYQSPRVQKYIFTTFNDPTSEFVALQGGSIDAMEWPLTKTQLTTLQANPKYQTNLSNDLGSVQVVFDNGRFPSNYTAYRQALSLMVDRQDVVVTTLQGLGGKMPDQLTPSWPSAYHIPGGFQWDINLAQANATLYAGGFRYTGGSGGFWYNLVNSTNKINPATTIFYSRTDDPHRFYIGTQVSLMQGATKSTYHFDRLFTVTAVTSFVAFRTSYDAPSSGGGGYASNNCNSTGFPCFTAYTQGISFGIADPSYLYFSFGTDFLDVNFQNFGHYVNATINSLVQSMYFDAVLNNTKVQLINKYVTQQAWWDPIYYQQDWNGLSDRVTGHLSAQNSVVPDGGFFFNNQYSYWRSHLKGRLYGGSIRLGVYNPIAQLNIFNPDSNFVYDVMINGRIYDSLLNFNYDTGGFMPGLATAVSVTTFTAPVYNSQFQRGGGEQWHTVSAAPYWAHNNTGTHIVSGERIDFTLLTNATWHDGSAVTPNDVIWNVVTAASDLNNLAATPYVALDDINATGNVIHMYFNATAWDTLTLAALNFVAPPLPFIHKLGTWVGTAGIVSGLSFASKASLNLSAAGGLDMLDGSGSYKFDTATTGDPFTVGAPFALIANNNWYYPDANKATYATGIADLTTYSTTTPAGPTLSLSIALVNGQNAKGDVFSGGNFVTDPTTVSDTTSGATVTAIIVENPSDTVTLAYNSGTGHWEGALPTTGATGIVHVQYTAIKSGSISTIYGPNGSSSASAVGVSWEGDPANTAFLAGAVPVFSPLQLFIGLITILAAVPIARRARQIRI